MRQVCYWQHCFSLSAYAIHDGFCVFAGKVNQSQLEVTDARNSLKMCQLKLEVANNRVGKLQGQLRQAIKASRYGVFVLIGSVCEFKKDLKKGKQNWYQ